MLKNEWLNKQMRGITLSLSKYSSSPVVWAPPQHIAIEITNICNLRCPMCKLGQKKLGRKIGMMDYAKYCGLIDEVSPSVRRISFPWYGEPFTHKDFSKFVRYASEKKLAIRIQTNGTYLNKCDLDFLVECNVVILQSELDISLSTKRSWI